MSYDEAAQRVILSFPEEIAAGAKSVLEINYSGVMNNVMAGFYRSRYKPAVPAAASVPRDEEYHFMFSTQFESCDARRAVPCFDEPNLKATFDFAIEIPQEWTNACNIFSLLCAVGPLATNMVIVPERHECTAQNMSLGITHSVLHVILPIPSISISKPNIDIQTRNPPLPCSQPTSYPLNPYASPLSPRANLPPQLFYRRSSQRYTGIRNCRCEEGSCSRRSIWRSFGLGYRVW